MKCPICDNEIKELNAYVMVEENFKINLETKETEFKHKKGLGFEFRCPICYRKLDEKALDFNVYSDVNWDR